MKRDRRNVNFSNMLMVAGSTLRVCPLGKPPPPVGNFCCVLTFLCSAVGVSCYVPQVLCRRRFSLQCAMVFEFLRLILGCVAKLSMSCCFLYLWSRLCVFWSLDVGLFDRLCLKICSGRSISHAMLRFIPYTMQGVALLTLDCWNLTHLNGVLLHAHHIMGCHMMRVSWC